MNHTVERGKPIVLVHDPAIYSKTYASLAKIRDAECSEQLRGRIFTGREVIEWHRIKDFQLVSLKLLAEQLLLALPVLYPAMLRLWPVLLALLALYLAMLRLWPVLL